MKLSHFSCTNTKKTPSASQKIRHEKLRMEPLTIFGAVFGSLLSKNRGIRKKLGRPWGATCEEVRFSFTRDFLLSKLSFFGKQQVDFFFVWVCLYIIPIFLVKHGFSFLLRFLKCRFLGRHENRELQQTMFISSLAGDMS